MQLQNKHAVIYGGGGAIGGAIATAFAREGATVYLAGRTSGPLEKIAANIREQGGLVHYACVDTLRQQAVEDHLAAIHEQAKEKGGSLDISVNAIGVVHVQGIPLADLSLADFFQPVSAYLTSNFLTATAAARVMIPNRSGVILTLSTPGSLLANASGFGVSNAAVEGMTRQLAGELGPHNIRVICLRPNAIPETISAGSHARDVFGFRAGLMGKTLDEVIPMLPMQRCSLPLPTQVP